ncbi:PDR/VanB family oxidoreductase [Microbacterium sp. No. 7]|uniref:PDR/VanB family oxidoreductase n=1 Tax=Microbacterium sp. No. 7 TaxID=1714373 RepID=UPI0006D14F00|nr:PDR/VanB family oxidoreductase [Microbacterium sp. No. 7]ALJ22267.1 ferredoxin [Microbacterium sp. No. 7]
MLDLTIAAPEAPDLAPDAIVVRIAERRRLTDRIDEFVLVAADGAPLPAWTPGAHIDLGLPGGPGLSNGLVRQYSLCSDPGDLASYRVAIDRRDDGRGGSRAARAALTPGSETWISPPRNHFPLVRALQYVFVAAGVGITPILALAAEARRSGRPWRVIYTARSRDDLAYGDVLRAWAPDRVTLHASRADGRLALDRELAGLPRGTAVYACGPAGLLDDVEAACAQQPAVDAFVERFSQRSLDTREDRPFEVSLALSGATFRVPPGCSVLEAVERRGVVVPSSCREGMCGTCETGVVSGEVDHRDSVLTPEERAENESMMICVSRCASGRLVLEL